MEQTNRRCELTWQTHGSRAQQQPVEAALLALASLWTRGHTGSCGQWVSEWKHQNRDGTEEKEKNVP